MLGLVYGAACQAWFNHVLLAPSASPRASLRAAPIDRRGRLDSNTHRVLWLDEHSMRRSLVVARVATRTCGIVNVACRT